MLMTGALLAYLGMDALMDMTGTWCTVPDVHLAKSRKNVVSGATEQAAAPMQRFFRTVPEPKQAGRHTETMQILKGHCTGSEAPS